MNHKPVAQSQHLTPFVIAAIFTVIALLWEWLFGQLVTSSQNAQAPLNLLLSYHKWLFIPLMAVILYTLIGYNNTELKRVIEHFRKSRELLHAILDSASSTFIYVKDLKGRYLLTSRAYEKMLNLTRDQLSGKTVYDLFPGDIAEQSNQHDEEVIAKRIPLDFEECCSLSDGLHTHLSYKFPLLDEQGECYAVCGIASDITDRIALEERLREGEEIQRLTWEAAHIGITTLDMEGRLRSANPSYCKLLGYSEEELKQMPLREIIHPDHWQDALRIREALYRGEIGSSEHERHYLHRDGSTIICHVYAAVVKDKAGNPEMLLCELQDITARKAMEEQLRKSERLLRLTLEHAPIAIATIDLEDRFISANPSHRRILGYSEKDLAHMHHVDIVHPEERYDIHNVAEEEFDTQGRYIKKDGGIIIGHVRSVLVRDDQDNPYMWVVQFEDITDRLATEAQLKEREELLRMTLEHAPIAIATINLEDRFLSANPSLCEIIGYSEDELLRMRHVDIIHHDDRYEVVPLEELSYDDLRKTIDTQQRYIHKDGTVIQAHVRAAFVLDADDKPQMYVVEFEDITESLAMEGKLRKSEELIQMTLENAPIGIFTAYLEGEFISANPAYCKLMGYSEEELKAMNAHDITHPEDLEATMQRIKGLSEGKISGYNIEKRYLRKDGSTIFCHTSVNVIKDPEDNSVMAVGQVLDITERIRGEQEVQRMRTYLENIVDSMPSVLVGVDIDGQVTEWNRAAKQMTGIEPDNALGKGFAELLPQLKSQMAKVQEAISTGKPVKTEKLVSERAGETYYSDVMVYPLVANGAVGAVVRVDDITATVRIQEMMVQTEKMLSVGGLAAGMAHEINNPLGTILQGCQNIMRRLSSDLPKNREVADELGFDLEKGHQYFEARGILNFLDLIQQAGSRAAKIVSDMLAFSRRSELHFLPADLADLVDTTIDLAASDYDLKKKYDFKQVQIERDYDPTVGSVECDKTEIEQVVLNLIKNAAQAMAEHPSGDRTPKIVLRIRAEPDYARIEVIDNGPGMNEQTRNRVFEPFFTTKEVGVGTGLGLSVSYFIITDQHGGKLNVESAPGEGARFIIRLPLNRTKE